MPAENNPDAKEGNNHKQGLCYEVKCTNSDCTSGGQTVVVPMGYGTSIYGRDKWKCVCPMCKTVCEGGVIEGVFATNCRWTMDGYTDKGVSKHDEGTVNGTQVLSMVNKCTWSHLEITTSPYSE